MDQPFSALDSYLKEELQFELQEHLREFGGTTIIVSHDRDEIYKLCDRTMVMGQGKILIEKETKKLFQKPERVMAARLTGCRNISRAKKTEHVQVLCLRLGNGTKGGHSCVREHHSCKRIRATYFYRQTGQNPEA